MGRRRPRATPPQRSKGSGSAPGGRKPQRTRTIARCWWRWTRRRGSSRLRRANAWSKRLASRWETGPSLGRSPRTRRNWRRSQQRQLSVSGCRPNSHGTSWRLSKTARRSASWSTTARPRASSSQPTAAKRAWTPRSRNSTPGWVGASRRPSTPCATPPRLRTWRPTGTRGAPWVSAEGNRAGARPTPHCAS